MQKTSLLLACTLMCMPTHTEARDFIVHNVVACWSEAAARGVASGYRELAERTGRKETDNVRPFVRSHQCRYLRPALFKPSKLVEMWGYDTIEAGGIVFDREVQQMRIVVDTTISPSIYFLLIGEHVAR